MTNLYFPENFSENRIKQIHTRKGVIRGLSHSTCITHECWRTHSRQRSPENFFFQDSKYVPRILQLYSVLILCSPWTHYVFSETDIATVLPVFSTPEVKHRVLVYHTNRNLCFVWLCQQRFDTLNHQIPRPQVNCNGPNLNGEPVIGRCLRCVCVEILDWVRISSPLVI